MRLMNNEIFGRFGVGAKFFGAKTIVQKALNEE